MKLVLEGYSVSDFQALGKDQSVDLTPGLWSLLGKNEDEGGSNASGKSSLARALNVGILGTKFSEVTVNEMMNRYGTGKPRIKVRLRVDDKPLSIDRIVGGKLSVSYDGEELEGKNEDIQQKIMDILGLTETQLNYLTNKHQESFGGFLMMKDKDKKDFLGSFFNLEKLEEAYDKEVEVLSKLTSDVQVSNMNIQALRAKVSNLDPQITDVGTKVLELSSEENVRQSILLSTQMLELTKEREALESRLSVARCSQEQIRAESPLYHKLHEAAQRYAQISSENGATIDSLTSKMSDLQSRMNFKVDVPKELSDNLSMVNEAISNFNKIVSQKASLTASINQANSEISRSENSVSSMRPDSCTTCGQPISTSKFEELRSKALAIHEGLVIQSRKLQGQLQDLNAFCNGTEIDGLSSARSDAVSAIDQFKKMNDTSYMRSEIQQVSSRISELRDVVNSAARELSTITQSVDGYAKQVIESMIGRISEIDKNMFYMNQTIKERESQASTLKASLLNLEHQRSKASEDVSVAEKHHSGLVEDMLVSSKTVEVLSKNGFLGHVFDSILHQLNGQLNENLKSIPVASKLSAYFTPDKITKTTKSMSKTITYKIFSGSDEVSFQTLSGGEKLSLILSVDDALEHVLCKRLGVWVSWKMLDEQLFWVDDHSKESILDFLRSKAHDKTYVVIDHAGEFNAAIDNQIIVTKRGGVATVKVCQ